jgi:hypothetical protein
MSTPSDHDRALRRQRYDYLYPMRFRLRYSNGGGSNLEIAAAPDNQNAGVWLYMIDNGRPEQQQPPTKMSSLLTPERARRLAYALLHFASETEIVQDDALTPR